MKKLLDLLHRTRRAIAARINMLLLAAFPFADQIITVIGSNLPAAADYLPANVYKWMGLIVVFANVVRDLLKPKAPK